MSILSNLAIAAAALACTASAGAADLGEAAIQRAAALDEMVAITVCASDGSRYFWAAPALKAALQGRQACFYRLGRHGDMGYVQPGASLVRTGAHDYRVSVDGQPVGRVQRVLTVPSSVVSRPELRERSGVLSYAGYSAPGAMSLHGVTYSDGTRDVVRAPGGASRLKTGSTVTVLRTRLDADTYWLSLGN